MDDDVRAELERLKAENEQLKRQQASALSLKVSAKGALSVYGLGRFPVTLYKGTVKLTKTRLTPVRCARCGPSH